MSGKSSCETCGREGSGICKYQVSSPCGYYRPKSIEDGIMTTMALGVIITLCFVFFYCYG